MIKQMATASLSRGTINGALIWSQITPNCMVMSSLAPWNASGMTVVDVSCSIPGLFYDIFWFGKKQRKGKERDNGKGETAVLKEKPLARSEMGFKGDKKTRIFLFWLRDFCFWCTQINGVRAGMSVTASEPLLAMWQRPTKEN